MRECIQWLLGTATPLIAVLFAPVPAYILWDAKAWRPTGLVLIPAFLALMAGYLDRSRSALRIALWLTGATYLLFAADALRLLFAGELRWTIVLPSLGGEALWIAVIVGTPAAVCTVLGSLLRKATLCSPHRM